MVIVEFFSVNEANHNLTMGPIRFGPFPFVQLTYELLRYGPDGNDLAVLDDGGWVLTGDDISGVHAGKRFSDVTLSQQEGAGVDF